MRIPDEQLDYLANCYLALEVGPLLQVTFYQYLHNIERCNELAVALHQGNGLHVSADGCRVVSVH